jgi:hypothetical protein
VLPAFSRAEHDQQLEGESPLPNLMEVRAHHPRIQSNSVGFSSILLMETEANIDRPSYCVPSRQFPAHGGVAGAAVDRILVPIKSSIAISTLA